MEKKEKKEEQIGEVKQEKKNDYTWLIIACIGGFLVFIIMSCLILLDLASSSLSGLKPERLQLALPVRV